VTKPLPAEALVEPAVRDGWRARLELVLRPVAARTQLVHDRHEGPLVVQRPFYESNGTCQVYLVHPPGGVAGGDEVLLDVTAETGAGVLLTAPGATKLYKSAGRPCHVRQRFAVASDAAVEWLPQETIVFDGAIAATTTRVELSPGARFIGWEIVSLGRPKSGERFERGVFAQSFELWHDGVPLWFDRGRFEGGERALLECYGLGGDPAFGIAVAFPATEAVLSLVREVEGIAATLVDGVLSCRHVGGSTREVRRAFTELWTVVRQPLLGKQPEAPRIWAT
jgi:urease accessory protein